MRSALILKADLNESTKKMLRNIDRENTIKDLFNLFKSEHPNYIKSINFVDKHLKDKIISYFREAKTANNTEYIIDIIDQLLENMSQIHIKFENWLKQPETTI